MLKKRFFTVVTISALLLCSFAGCSKKKETPQNTTPTPTASVSEETPETVTPIVTKAPALTYIPLSGNFSDEKVFLSFGLIEDNWHVLGYCFPEDGSSILLSGPITLGEGASFTFTENENELTFVLSTDSVTVTVNKGTTYAAFAGTYPRREDTSSDTEMLSPEHGSALELLGRIALTSYLVNAEGLPECMLDLSDKTFDNEYMKKFLLTYTDLFLVSESDVFTEGSDKYLYYAFTEDSLNDLFATVSAGSFSLTDFNISGSDIHFVNGTYYVPCLGIYSGGLLTPEADPELVSDTLTLNGVVSKSDNTDFDIKMILSTEENTASGTTGIKITAISYRLVQ